MPSFGDCRFWRLQLVRRRLMPPFIILRFLARFLGVPLLLALAALVLQ